MKWRNISEVPKQKNRMILFAEWHTYHNGYTVCIQEYLADSYADALYFRKYEMKHSFTHWCYATPPKDLKPDTITKS